MEKKFYDISAEIKAVEQDDEKNIGVFEGFGSIFGNVDSYGDIVAKGAFEESLQRNGMPALLLQHNSMDIGGVYTQAEEKENGLFLKGELNLDVQKAREAYSLMKQGALKGLSIGFVTKEDEFDRDTGIRTIKRVDLMEVSLVTFPANKEAMVTQVKSLPETERQFEKFLRDAGYGQTQSKAIVSDGFKGYLNMQRDVDTADNLDDVQRDVDELKEALNKTTTTLKEIINVRQSKRD